MHGLPGDVVGVWVTDVAASSPLIDEGVRAGRRHRRGQRRSGHRRLRVRARDRQGRVGPLRAPLRHARRAATRTRSPSSPSVECLRHRLERVNDRGEHAHDRAARKASVLVVDDEAAIRDSLRMILEYEGYRVEEASSGARGAGAGRRPPPERDVPRRQDAGDGRARGAARAARARRRPAGGGDQRARRHRHRGRGDAARRLRLPGEAAAARSRAARAAQRGRDRPPAAREPPAAAGAGASSSASPR